MSADCQATSLPVAGISPWGIEHGLRRRVARTSSTFLDIAFLVAETDYVVSLPESIARPLLGRLGLAILDMPLRLPSFTHSMVWHRRYTNEPAHAWFRALVGRAVKRVRLGEPNAGLRARPLRSALAPRSGAKMTGRSSFDKVRKRLGRRPK